MYSTMLHNKTSTKIYVFSRLCRILTSLPGDSKYKKRVKVLNDTTFQNVLSVIYYPTALYNAHLLQGRKSEVDREA